MRYRSLLLLLPLLAVLLRAEDSLGEQAKELYRAKRFPEARGVYEKIVAAEPNNAEAHFYLGDLAGKRGDNDESVKQFEQAVALEPKNANYLVELGGAYGQSAEKASIFSKFGLAKKCLACLEKAVELEPDNLVARQAAFSYYRAAPSIVGGGIDKALAEAREIQKRDPILGAALLGQVYLDDKKITEAFALYEATLKTAPDNYGLLYAIGRGAAQTGTHLYRGEQALRRCLELTPGPNDAPMEGVHWRLGNIAEKRGNVAAAKAAYQAALELNPHFKPAAESLAKLK